MPVAPTTATVPFRCVPGRVTAASLLRSTAMVPPFLHHLAQLVEVSRPAVAPQRRLGLRREIARGAGQVGAAALEEVASESADVVRTVAQRRQLELFGGQSLVEVVAEQRGGDARAQ